MAESSSSVPAEADIIAMNIPSDCTEAQLASVFAPHAPVQRAALRRKSDGTVYGVVTFANEEVSRAVLRALHGIHGDDGGKAAGKRKQGAGGGGGGGIRLQLKSPQQQSGKGVGQSDSQEITSVVIPSLSTEPQAAEAVVRYSRRWWEQPGSLEYLEMDRKWRDFEVRRKREVVEMAKGIQRIPSHCYSKEVRHLSFDNATCYRIYNVESVPQVFKKSTAEEAELLDDEGNELDAERCTVDPETGHFTIAMPEVGPQFYKFIIGSKGAVRDAIEKDTGATIAIPKPNADPGACLVVRGVSQAICIAAKQRIDIVVAKSAKMVDHSHFISIPLSVASHEVSELLGAMDRKFSGKARGIEPSIFQTPSQLHLTMLMLRLYNPDELSKARHLLNQAQMFIDDIFRPTDRVSLRGLNYMNDDPSEVHVLYLQVAENETREKILRLVEFISDLFIGAELATANDIEHNEKLHATLLNSKWRKSAEQDTAEDKDGGSSTLPDSSTSGTGSSSVGPGEKQSAKPPRKRYEDRIPFDIRPIMKEFQDVRVGEFPLRTLELSRLSVKDPETGYWVSDHTVPFPTELD